MVESLCIGTLQSLGIDIINLGLSTTPTVEFAVPKEKAQGGIILTASHNPKQWNALKLLNEKGEFISENDGRELMELIAENKLIFNEVDHLGKTTTKDNYIDLHIKDILSLEGVDISSIEKANFNVVIDAVNSTGGIALPKLLKALKCYNITELYCTPNGDFHNPEPLPTPYRIDKTVIDKKQIWVLLLIPMWIVWLLYVKMVMYLVKSIPWLQLLIIF